MIFYDLIHGYQPFDPLIKVSKWVRRNLKDKFLPTSFAMKQGIIPRGVQLQAWTIESWLKACPATKSLAKKTFANLRAANQKKNIEIGSSAYSHAILPMLSSNLIRAQIILDREVVEKYLGKPTWFWPPEGAIDKRTLKIIHEIFPDLILLIPDKSLGKYNFHGPMRIKFKDGYQRAIVYSCLFKDLFMNAEDYRKRPKYTKRPKRLPKELVWARTRRAVHSKQMFLELLDFINNYRSSTPIVDNGLVLMRDWENAGSKKGLRKTDQKVNAKDINPASPTPGVNSVTSRQTPGVNTQAKDIGVFVKLRDQIDFRLPSQFNWQKAEIIPISKILPASWDIPSTPRDPFPWWQPNKYGKIWRHRKPLKRRKIAEWQELVKEYDIIFQQKIKKHGGLEKALKDKEFKKLLKQTLPAVHSCVGWHYFAKRAWGNYSYAKRMTENIVLPNIEKLKRDL